MASAELHRPCQLLAVCGFADVVGQCRRSCSPVVDGTDTPACRLFPEPPPVVHVPARQYPVTLHFARRTELRDYLGAAFKKVRRLHFDHPTAHTC